eukprot:5103894-Karenia_brevis.AAC.1
MPTNHVFGEFGAHDWLAPGIWDVRQDVQDVDTLLSELTPNVAAAQTAVAQAHAAASVIGNTMHDGCDE